ncbi:uroporphyrinogen-III synthase [Mesobacterium sp. TK19101]|uniref:Uroporphyrinogen-III synthase n=2 Tax=Mesobacterium hydrothermale TaxID=3111907 RepID=A0ABU6HHK2_9RHOB|nr:uroporphyrinogen-III synthase [Mesobacterium sp. TK19101]
MTDGVPPDRRPDNPGKTMFDTRPYLLMTRPEAAGQRFWQGLPKDTRDGLRLVISPLIETEVTGPLPDLRAYDGVILTSAHAVAAFRALGGHAAGLTCFTVGAATARAATEAGFVALSANGDADDLVRLVCERAAGQRLIHLHGTHTRGDVSVRLTAANVQTDSAPIYDQRALGLSQQAQDVLSGDTPIVVPLFSPRTAALFAAGFRGDAPLFLACMSQAVAAEVASLPAKEVSVASNPDAKAMTATVAPLASRAARFHNRE